jgi:Fis family transcriptional regulator
MSQHPINENEISAHVRESIVNYFKDLDGEEPICTLYDMVMNCVEKPLLEVVLTHVEGNQTRAANLLGLNRNTLRKKMTQHGLS